MKKNNYALYLAGLVKEEMGADGQPPQDDGQEGGEEKGSAVQKLIEMLKDGSLLKELMQSSEPKTQEQPAQQAPATPPQPQQLQQ